MAPRPPPQWQHATTSAMTVLPRSVFFRAYPIAAGTCIDDHQHVWWQFMFARQGLMQVQADGIALTLPPEYGMWIPAHCRHTLWAAETIALESLYIDVRVLDTPPPALKVVAVDDFARTFIHHACTHIDEHYDEDGAEGRKVSVLLEVLQALPVAAFNLPFPTESKLLAICLAIQHAPHLPHGREDAAARMHLSPQTFSRHFLRATGLPYHTWRQRMRLVCSLSLLREGKSVTEAAFAVGYTTPSAYIYAFKQLFATSPRRFSH